MKIYTALILLTAVLFIPTPVTNAQSKNAEPSSTQANSPVVRMTVLDENVRRIQDTLFGHFLCRGCDSDPGPELLMEPGTRHLQPAIEKMLLDMHVPLMRFPGGTNVDYMDWQDLISNAPGRSPERPYAWQIHSRSTKVPNNFGFDEYFLLRDKLKCQTLLVVNFLDGLSKKVPLEQAALNSAGLVAYVNAPQGASLPAGMPDWPAIRAKNGHPEPYHIEYIQLGNELFMGGIFNKAIAAAGTKDPAELSKWYITCLHAYIEKIHQIDPDIKIIIDGRLGLGLEKYVLADPYIRQHIKCVTFHMGGMRIEDIWRDGRRITVKDLSPQELWNAWVTLQCAYNADGEAYGFGSDSEAEIKHALSLGYHIACTEWAWLVFGIYGTEPIKDSLPFGRKAVSMLGTAGFYHGLIRRGDVVDLTCLSILMGQSWPICSVMGFPDGKTEPYYTSQGAVVKFYGQYRGPWLMKSTIEGSPTFTQPLIVGYDTHGIPKVMMIDALATGSKDKLFVHVINRAKNDDIPFSVDLNAFHINSGNAKWHLISTRLNDKPQEGQPIKVYNLEEREAAIKQGSITVVLPAHSISILEISREGPNVSQPGVQQAASPAASAEVGPGPKPKIRPNAAALADDAPRLADIFQDGMVLQREMPVPVWGWTAPNAKVDVSFAGQNQSATADAKGYWKVVLQPLKASQKGSELVMHSGGSQITLKNIVVGEVWVAVGASLMGTPGPDLDTGVFPHYVSPGTAGGTPEIRIREFGWGASLEPLEDTLLAGRGKLKWEVLPENPPKKEMGVQEYFSRVIRDDQKVPVGLIHAAWVGINQWSSRKTMESFPATSGTCANYYEQLVAAWENGLAKSTNGAMKTLEDVQKSLEKQNGQSPGIAGGYPAVMYNTRIHPLAPFAMRGVILLQLAGGEQHFVAQIKQWRELFGQKFYLIVGTHTRDTFNYQPPLKPMVGSFYRSAFDIRNALPLFGQDSKVEYVELFDVGDYSVHYRNMAESARRLGLAALTKAYGEPHDYTGPRVKESKIEGGKVRIEFEDCGTGLVYRPSINGISGIFLRGSDGVARWAEVKLLNTNTIECSHPDIGKLQYAAYAYYPNAHETLFNSGGLPASPFELNPDKIKLVEWTKPGDYALVKFENEKESKGLMLSLSHVRRDGYVFCVLGSSKASILAYVPDEWKGCEVEVGGRVIPAQSVTENGAKFVRFEVDAKTPNTPSVDPLKLQNIIVAAPGKAAEFRKINRY